MSEKRTKTKSKTKEKTNYRKLAALRKVAKSFDDKDSPDEDGEEPTESIFRGHLEKLKKLEKKGVKGEAYDIAVLKSLRTLVQDLIPVAEDNYRKFPSHTAAAAVNHYINQEREIMNDIRALEDFRARANRIVGLVSEEMQQIAKAAIEQSNSLKTSVAERSSKNVDDLFKTFLKLFGRALQDSQERVGDRIMEFMVSEDKK